MTRYKSSAFRSVFTLFCLAFAPLACSGEGGEAGSGATGGAGTMSGGGPGTGGLSSGGTGTGGFGGPGSGGLGSGGLGSGGLGSGGVGSGGLGSGGVGTGGFGTGGDSSGGAPGDGGSMGTGGDSMMGMANPSPGCSLNNGRPNNGIVYKAGESWLVFPESYDGSTPYPVVVAFHGCGGGNKGNASNTTFKGAFDNTEIGDNYVRALPLSVNDSGCYDTPPSDMNRAKALFTELVENYCVDLDRVFGVGHSYGAGFLMGMTGNPNDFNHFGFRGISPVAGWSVNASVQVPTLYIQGIMDQERGGGDGADVAAGVANGNGCGMSTTDFPTISCNSNSGGSPVDSGCVEYSGCDETTIYCRHNDPNYGTSYHGIPCFWYDTVYDFFESL